MTEPASEEAEVTYRPVPGAAGYRVGDDGTLWSRVRMGSRRESFNDSFGEWFSDSWRLMKGRPQSKSNHLRVKITLDDHSVRNTHIHVLVLESFVGPCPEGLECRHLNGDPTDNRVGNLAWGTRLENSADTRAHGRLACGDRNGNSRVNRAKRAENEQESTGLD